MQPKIMYVECKAGSELSGAARIGRVTFRTGTTVYYRGKTLQRGSGFKSNFFDVETRVQYWVSGCRKDGRDRLYGGTVEIDEDVREEYWTAIRGQPGRKAERFTGGASKY